MIKIAIGFGLNVKEVEEKLDFISRLDCDDGFAVDVVDVRVWPARTAKEKNPI